MQNMGRTVLRMASAAVIAIAVAQSANAADMTGAGSTFAFPILAKWAEAYKASTGSNLNYQSIGSGGGINQIEAKTVDFGATDKPLSAADLEKNGLTQFPFIMGGIVLIINLLGFYDGRIPGLRLLAIPSRRDINEIGEFACLSEEQGGLGFDVAAGCHFLSSPNRSRAASQIPNIRHA